MPRSRRVFECTGYVREKMKTDVLGVVPLPQTKAWHQRESGKSKRAHEKHQRIEAPERKPSQSSPSYASLASTPSQSQASARGHRDPPGLVGLERAC